MSNDVLGVQPGDKVKVLVYGQVSGSASPGVWVVNLNDDDGDYCVYVRSEELLPPAATASSVHRAQALEEFALWVTALDDPAGPGFEARRSVTMSQIIGRACEALGLPREF